LRRASGTDIPNEPAEADPYLKCELAGHIEIRQLAGIGAMGRVYRAFQRGVERDVAVKILHRELSSNPQLVSRFTREAKVASKLQHPNVVSVVLTGQMPDGALYIVMEFLDGMSLMSALAAAGGALPLPRALHIAVQLADAVGEAHSQGIIHRDLKPENVMLVRRGEDRDFVKVLDFGIARMHWGEQSMATAAGLIFGTARYISPEGARGEAVTAASDVYSIATLTYQMISGRTPFEGDQAVGLLVQQIHDKPPPLRSLTRAAYVPEPIADVIMQGLAKDQNEREKDARSFGRALIDAARAAGLSSDEISRPIIAGRNSVVSLPSKERTKQHEIGADVRERMGSIPSDPRVTPEPLATEPRNEARGSLGSAGNATVKWTPPPNIAAQLGAEPARAVSSPELVPAPAATRRQSTEIDPPANGKASAIDTTLDDATPPPILPQPSQPSFPPPYSPKPSSPALPRTDYAAPVQEPSGPIALPTPAPSGTLPTPPPSAPRPSYPSKPPSNVDTTLSDADMARRGKVRAFALVFVCFVLGAGLATLVAYRMGRIGPEAGHEELVLLAQAALSANHLTDPPGDNVRDITDTGQKRWPDDSRFPALRKRAAEELTARAIAAHATSDGNEARRLIHLAAEMDSENAAAKKLAGDWDGELTATHADQPPAMPSAKPLSQQTHQNGGVGVAGAKLTFDVSNPKPRIGSAVDFNARITGAKKVEDAHISIVSASTPSGMQVVATESGGVYHAGFTFLEPGKYEVVFVAKVDGNVMKSSRLVVAGDMAAPVPSQTAAPSATTPANTATPAPSGTVKWM
jgi:serine/threonine-protein kinase